MPLVVVFYMYFFLNENDDVLIRIEFVCIGWQQVSIGKLILETKIWINISPGNGLLPDGTKSLPDLTSLSSSDILMRAISQEIPQ